MDMICKYYSPLGVITLASEGEKLKGLWFDGQKFFANNIDGECEQVLSSELQIFDITSKWLDIYFNGQEPDFIPPIDIQATEFQKNVIELMLKIPYGKTMTYCDIAKTIAQQKGIKRMSAQAVGCAVGRNPISIIIPCHRVVGKNNKLTGYAGGLDKKAKLLEIEAKGGINKK